jgi:glycosyltransferase involved in cell wall biosynthesis
MSRPDVAHAIRPSRPLVSVIMPAYNVAPFLEDSAASALAQSYPDLELLIIDDGSKDDTASIAERIQRENPSRVRVIRRANGGLAAARNTALSAARGEFFALLDSDDLWEPGFLEHQMKTFSSAPSIDLVTANGRYLGGAWHGELVRPCPDRRPPTTLSTIIADEQAVFVMTVFRRRVYETIGGFDETLRTNEDFDYWLRAALAGFQFARNPEPLAWYRRRDGSLSSDAPRMLRGALRVCVKARALIADRPERALLERQIAYYEAELDAALVREALASGDGVAAAQALASLNSRRPSVRTAIAAVMARHAGSVLSSVYRLTRRATLPKQSVGPIAGAGGPTEVTTK